MVLGVGRPVAHDRRVVDAARGGAGLGPQRDRRRPGRDPGGADDDESDDDRPDALMFSSSVRTIPLRAVVDQGLRTRFRVEPDGARTLHTVMLYLSTQTPERSSTSRTGPLTVARWTSTPASASSSRISRSAWSPELSMSFTPLKSSTSALASGRARRSSVMRP